MKAEALLAAQQRIHDQIADAMPLETIVTSVCALGEQVLPDAVVSVMLHDASTATLRLVQTGSFSQEYWAAAQQIPVGPHDATCGVAAYTKDVVITTDIHQSPDWSAYRHLADREGLRACWSTPVLGREDRLLGTFAVYYRAPREPSSRDRKLLHGLNRLLAVAFRLHQDQEELRLLQRGVDASPTGMLLVDARQENLPVVYANRGFERITGYPRSEVMGRNCRFLQGENTSQEVLDQLRHALRHQREVQVLLRNYRRDGSGFWNELTVGPVLDEAGRCTHFFGIQHDVSRQVESDGKSPSLSSSSANHP